MFTRLTKRAAILLGSSALIASAGILPAQAQNAAAPAAPNPAMANSAVASPLVVQADQPGAVINRDIFGQFAEHLGQGIYGGIWVGKDSSIPNVRGIRSDVVAALRAIKVPVVRWPGGCFADRYDWRDGIGPAAKRPARLNAVWGGVVEPNTFGTPEFMDFADQIGADAYVSVNVGSGTPEQASQWMEYMTTDQPTALEQQRVADGHPKPFKVKYIGLGNEMWGCGGAMSGEAYVDRMKRFDMFVNSSHPDQVDLGLMRHSPQAAMRVAVGDNSLRNDFTEAVMKAWAERDAWSWNIEGLSMHHYTWGEAMLSSLATGFGEKQYAGLLSETLNMDKIISTHSATMDKYDPKKKVALVIDEWGVWLKAMPGLNPMFLKQQDSLRDGIAASMNFDIFIRHADRVRMANIAQMANVLQTMVLTDGAKMVVTPTYYVFKLYVPFQDATVLPITFDAGEYKFDRYTLPKVDAIAARGKDGKVWLALTNLDPHNAADVSPSVAGTTATSAEGEVLTADRIDSINTFDAPHAVEPKPFSAKADGGVLVLHLPPHSVTVVHLAP